MRPARTAKTNRTIGLEGGDARHDLPCQVGSHAGIEGLVDRGDPGYHQPFIASTWEPDPLERAAIATGANLEVVIWGTRLPPLALGITREPLTGEPLRASTGEGPRLWFEVGEELARDLAAMLQAVHAAPATAPPPLKARHARLEELRAALELGLADLSTAEPEAPA